jgi:hypothetical protein
MAVKKKKKGLMGKDFKGDLFMLSLAGSK